MVICRCRCLTNSKNRILGGSCLDLGGEGGEGGGSLLAGAELNLEWSNRGQKSFARKALDVRARKCMSQFPQAMLRGVKKFLKKGVGFSQSLAKPLGLGYGLVSSCLGMVGVRVGVGLGAQKLLPFALDIARWTMTMGRRMWLMDLYR